MKHNPSARNRARLASRVIPLVAAGALVGALGAVSQRQVATPDKTVRPDGAVLLPNGWKVTPAGRPLALPGDMPLTMRLTPDGKSLLVNTAGYNEHGVSVIDLASEKVTQSVDLGKDWMGLCLSPDGSQVYVSGAGAPTAKFLNGAEKQGATPAQMAAFGNPIMRLSLTQGTLRAIPGLSIPGLAPKQQFVGGLATGPDGAVFVANFENDTVYRLSAPPPPADTTPASVPATVAASVKVGSRPYALALSPDGKTLAVANWAGDSVSLLLPGTLQETARVAVGSRPNALVWTRDGRLFVADAGSNSVSVLRGAKVIETISTALTPKALVGSTPDAIAASPDGKRVFVANADNNDVAVIDTSDARESRVIGFLPTGWYPSSLAVSADGKKLFIGTGKGLNFRPNARPDTHVATKERLSAYDYIGTVLEGTVSVVDLPDASGLTAYTKQVVANTPAPQSPATWDPGNIQKNVFSRIKHVVYIIRENRTYDQVFGDLPEGNGDARLTLFGADVTPNAHALAQKYVLFDNLFCNAEVSEDGHQWCDAAYATDYTERAWPLAYSGRGEPADDDDLSQSPAGYLWDNCARHGLSFRTYGERSKFTATPGAPPVFAGPKTLDGHANYDYARIAAMTGKRDQGRAQVFIDDLHKAESSNDWPNFMVLSLGEDHTQGLKAGTFTPTAHVGSNDQALGKIVEAVSHSKYWASTAIFVVEDDAQNGPDHVDAHRTVGLVLSPYIRRNAVDSTLYTQASMIHTIELILGLPPMTQYDQTATPMYDAFTAQPDMTAYVTVAPKVNLLARNPGKGAGAVASAKLDLSDFDRADPDALNAILWHALKPGVPMPAPVRSARLVR